jgi:hypothetical protein
MHLIDQNARAEMELIQKALTPRDGNPMELWTIALGAVRTNTEALLRISTRAVKTTVGLAGMVAPAAERAFELTVRAGRQAEKATAAAQKAAEIAATA